MAAGDMAIAMLLTATDLASVVVSDMAATYDAAMLNMADSTLLLNDSLVALTEQTVGTGGGFDALSASVDVSAGSLDALDASIDTTVSANASLAATMEEDTAIISALNEQVVALQAQLDILTASEDANAASTEASALSMESFMTVGQGAGAVLSGMVMPALLAAGATLGIGVASVKMAGDFQSSMLKVQAYVGMTQQQTQQMGQSILQMAPQLGVAPKALADSLYFVASAGFKGADALTVLKYAGMTAAASNTDASVTGFALVASLNALNLKASDAGNISDELNATVKNGVMTWQQYGSVIGKIAGSVSSAGGNAQMLQHNFMDLNASLDVYTNSGISAHQASMWLNADMSVLYGKAGTLATNAHKLKISFDANAYSSMDFAQRLQYLNQITGGNHQELVKLVGGNSQVANSVSFLNAHYGSLNSTIQSISGTMQHGKSTQDMFNIASQGLNFQLEKAKSAGQAFMITLGSELLPVFTHLVAQVIPIITHLMQWEQHTHTIQNVITGLVTTIVNLITFGVQLVAFFQNNQAAMVALKATLVVAAVVIGVLMVAAFVAWAIAAWNAAVATIAATWPVLLIIAAIALLVVGIILLVQHWGQVVAFLRGIWQAFASWFMGALRATGAFFVGVWQAIASFFIGVWNHIVAGVQAAVNFIVTVVKVGFALWLAYITFPIRMVVALFEWLYNHNYYFKALVDFIVNVFKAGLAWLVGAWQNTVSFLSGLWRATASLASSVWSAVTGFISAQVSRASGFIRSVWSAVVGFLAGIWASISSGVSSMWAKVSGFFAAAWGTYISGPLHSLWSAITGFVGGWASQAVQWGVNLIKGFISGITSMIGAVGNAAHNVISTVAGFLGFHSPAEKGEGRYIVEWGAGMVKGFVSGMQSAMPLLNAQVSHMIQAPNSIAYGGHSGAGSGNAFALTGGQTIVVQVQPAKADISLDKKKVGEGVMQYAAKEIRLQGSVRNK